MRTDRRLALILALMGLVLAPAAFAHCQIPCGIFDDDARFAEMREHVTTIEKSMRQIDEIGAQEKPNWNQLVRWVDNKDHHADELSEIATYYFLAQRIKPPAEGDDAATKKYLHELTLLHHVMVHAMKSKHGTDQTNIAKLHELIDAFEKSYKGEHGHAH
ncbi:MAG: superoxide dismutase [Ni] [Acidobacteriota bacterium]